MSDMRVLVVYQDWRNGHARKETHHTVMSCDDPDLAERVVRQNLQRRPLALSPRDIITVVAETREGYR